jgi:hypothetical protein
MKEQIQYIVNNYLIKKGFGYGKKFSNTGAEIIKSNYDIDDTSSYKHKKVKIFLKNFL